MPLKRLTAAQKDAGNGAMKGDFTLRDVEAALLEAGVPEKSAFEQADKLSIIARDAGKVVFIGGKLWRQTA